MTKQSPWTGKTALKSVDPEPARADNALDSDLVPRGKLGLLVQLLRRDVGASLDELMAATGWQAHSVRGALSGTLKKKLGLAITSEKRKRGRFYRIVEPAA
jgi:hypothetical protein